MSRIFQYYGQYQSLKGGMGLIPGWGRVLLVVAAIPGLVLLALSILAVGVSILALLLLTVPAYKLVRLLSGSSGSNRRTTVEGVIVEPAEAPRPSSPFGHQVFVGDVANEPEPRTSERRSIDVKIVE
jgi:hypothetical protein